MNSELTYNKHQLQTPNPRSCPSSSPASHTTTTTKTKLNTTHRPLLPLSRPVPLLLTFRLAPPHCTESLAPNSSNSSAFLAHTNRTHAQIVRPCSAHPHLELTQMFQHLLPLFHHSPTSIHFIFPIGPSVHPPVSITTSSWWAQLPNLSHCHCTPPHCPPVSLSFYPRGCTLAVLPTPLSCFIVPRVARALSLTSVSVHHTLFLVSAVPTFRLLAPL